MHQLANSAERLVAAALAAVTLLLASASAAAQKGNDPFGQLGGPQVVVPSDEPNVVVEVHADTAAAVPGGEVVVAVVLDHADGWHSWPAAGEAELGPDFDLIIRTEIGLGGPDGIPDWIGAVGEVQWPKLYEAPVANPTGGPPVTVPLYEGRAIAFLPLRIGPDVEPGPRTLDISYTYQSCNDQVCDRPVSETASIELEILPPDGVPRPAETPAGLFDGFDRAAFASMAAPGGGAAPPVSGGGGTFFGLSLGALSGPGGLVLLALLSAVGGLVLNLTPCVLPVIPIKVMTLSQHGGSPGKSFMLGLWMALGVVAFWVGIGIPAAFVAAFTDPSRMFGIWWVTGGIGLIIAVMSLGLMGLFQIKLPQKAYMVSPEADSPGGSFLFGVMTAVLGLPCFGFVAGALVPAAAALGKFGTLLVFGGIGVGMAAPYLVLAAKPSWVSSLPRTGPASELVKQVMGLLLLAAAAYFLGAAGIALVQEHPYLGSKLHYWVIAFFGVLAGGLLAVRTIQIAKSPAAKAIFSAVGLLIGAAGVLVAWNTTEQARADYASSTWEEYSPELVAASTAAGKVVVMDFTAEWCINCKALKAAVLNVDPVRSVLEQPDVVAIKVDLTSDSAPGWDLLRKTYRQTGIPTLVVQGPGANAPWVANAYGPEGVLSAIRAAQGDEAVAAGSAAANR